MITKAIVTQLVPPNKFKVRIPIFDGFSGQQGAVSDEHLSNATLCTLPNSDNVINVGDIVYVAFEDNDAGRPVILGHLYTGTSKTNTIIDLSVRELNVTDKPTNGKYSIASANLPSNTRIGNLTYYDILGAVNFVKAFESGGFNISNGPWYTEDKNSSN